MEKENVIITLNRSMERKMYIHGQKVYILSKSKENEIIMTGLQVCNHLDKGQGI